LNVEITLVGQVNTKGVSIFDCWFIFQTIIFRWKIIFWMWRLLWLVRLIRRVFQYLTVDSFFRLLFSVGK